MVTAALTAENQLLREQVGVVVEKIEDLSLELARLKRQVVGPKSERRTPDDPAQGLLCGLLAFFRAARPRRNGSLTSWPTPR